MVGEGGVYGKEAKTLVVEGGFLAAVSRENRSSSPSSSNKRSVFLGVFGEAFGWNERLKLCFTHSHVPIPAS